MCGTGRCFLSESGRYDEHLPLQWDEGATWELFVEIEAAADGERYQVTGRLRRGDSEMDLTTPDLLLEGGLVIYDGRVARLQDHGAFGWVSPLRAKKAISFTKDERERFLDELLQLPHQPRLALPEDLKFETAYGTPNVRSGMAMKVFLPRATAGQSIKGIAGNSSCAM